VRGFEKDPHLFEGHGTSSTSASCSMQQIRTRTFGVGAILRRLARKPINHPSSDELRSSSRLRRTISE
jgi:hypothetical protein